MDKIPIGLQIAELIRRFGNDPVKCTGKILSITNRIKSNDNPFCNNCKETDCEVSHDETCNMIRKYLSMRVKCPKCGGTKIVPLYSLQPFIEGNVKDCPSCKDGWIYPDPQKMYEAIDKCIQFAMTLPITGYSDGMKKAMPEFIDLLKQAIKGEG